MIPALALCAALLGGTPTFATGFCTCVGPRTEAEAVRFNDVVFEGRVVRVRPVAYGDGFRGYIYTFVVTRWRKGTPIRTIDVLTGEGGGDCGMAFDEGRIHTVYAHRDDGDRLWTTICSGPSLPSPREPHSGGVR